MSSADKAHLKCEPMTEDDLVYLMNHCEIKTMDTTAKDVVAITLLDGSTACMTKEKFEAMDARLDDRRRRLPEDTIIGCSSTEIKE